MTNRALQRQIFAGCRELGLDTDTRRDLQLVATGKDSLSDMSEAEMHKVVAALKERGWRPSAGAKGRRPAANRADVRFCHVMWRLLHEKGAVKASGAKGLNAFIRARFEKKWGSVPIDIDTMQDWSEIADIVDALKAMCLRNGIEVRR
ncbi:regulatory protein GemA [Defluviimonas sp. WL0024]|uniref:Regulatory protein GemA n=1 Tax=Albidovulum salinarum TaxID=2984153 RepID=A0ABT2X9D8_9RHOB|nr:regulatory protein GemA [Defluviimonas sp. WL0024]MCU9850369.1 regulatory protein GemA [Defluviimonas sp. WL0024]